MNKWRVLALGLTVVVLLGLLAAGLQTLEFRGGHQYAISDLEQPGWGESAVLPLPYALMERILEAMPWFILGILILGAVVFRRKLLREVIRFRVLIVFMVLLALIGLRAGHGLLPVEEEVEQEFIPGPPAESWQPPFPPPEPGPGDTTPQSPPQLPWWVTYLVATALAVPAVWLGWHFVRRAARRKQTEVSDDSLQDIAAEAAAELRAGLPFDEVVIRCWARMAEILARRAGGNAPQMTPRELASVLTRWGVRHEAVADLTRLFEEVRYGSKADAPRRDRAIAALAEIEEAYGPA